MRYRKHFTVLVFVVALCVAVLDIGRLKSKAVKYFGVTTCNTITETEKTTLVMDANIDPSLRETELSKLSDLIQRRLHYIQNPKSCQDTKKVLCSFNKGDRNDIDEIPVLKLPKNAEIKNRPKYLPYAIPEDIADDILRLHKDPYVWWIGQFLVFLTRPNRRFVRLFEDNLSALKFRHPIVGVHVRRTDKLVLSGYYQLEEYMTHVKVWFDTYEKDHKVDRRRVYIVSDDDDVLTEARLRYPDYTFLFNESASVLAKSKTTRYSESSLRGFVLDIHTLSMCDFVVCTLTSNVARYIYLLMTARYWDAPDRIYSLDTGYSFTGRSTATQRLEKKRKTGKFNITQVPSHGIDVRRPMFATDNDKSIVKMPTYVEVPRV